MVNWQNILNSRISSLTKGLLAQLNPAVHPNNAAQSSAASSSSASGNSPSKIPQQQPNMNQLIFLEQEERLEEHLYYGLLRWDSTADHISWLDYLASRLTSVDVGALRSSQENMSKYLAHLAALKGEDRKGTELEGWSVDNFLPLRIRATLKMIIDRELKIKQALKDEVSDHYSQVLGMRAPSAKVAQLRQEIASLKQEALHELHTLRLYQLNESIKQCYPKQALQLFEALAETMLVYLQQPLARLQLAIHYPKGHMIYVNLERDQDKVSIRVDNLGYASNWEDKEGRYHRLHLNKEIEPCFAGRFALGELLKAYIVNLFELSLPAAELLEQEEQDGFARICRPQGAERLIPPDYSALRFIDQGDIGNCSVAGHQVGLRARLSSEEAFPTFLRDEHAILAQLKDRPTYTDSTLHSFSRFEDTQGVSRLLFTTIDNYYRGLTQVANTNTLKSLPHTQLEFSFFSEFDDPRRYYTPENIDTLLQDVCNNETGVVYHDKLLSFDDLLDIFKAFQADTSEKMLIQMQVSEEQRAIVFVERFGDARSISYFNPWGAPFPEVCKTALEEAYPQISIHTLTQALENPDIDAGPALVEVAKRLLIPPPLFFRNWDIAVIRKSHTEILTREERRGVLSLPKVVEHWQLNGPARGLWLSAPAGYGKTLLSGYMATQTSIGFEEERKIWIKLRHVSHLFTQVPGMDIEDLTVSLIWQSSFEAHTGRSQPTWWERKAIVQSLEESPILYLFDGYDELPEEAQVHFVSFVQALKNRYIVTSRPQSLPHFAGFNNAFMLYYVAPFSNEKMDGYIEKFFGAEQDKAAQLQSFLQGKASWQQLMITPFNLELLCNVWQNQSGQKMTLHTVTDLYRQILHLMLKHAYLKKHGHSGELREGMLTGYYKEAIRTMESLAFEFMTKKQLRAKYRPTSLMAESVCADINDIGFLQLSGDTVEYIHKTFCEFMCALYIAKNLHKDPNIALFIAANKYDPYFSRVWSFTAGLLHQLNKAHQRQFWKLLLQKPWDLMGARQIPLLIACLEESQCNAQVPEAVLRLLDQCWSIVQKFFEQNETYLGSDTNLKKTIMSSLASAPYLVNVHLENKIIACLKKTKQKWALLSGLGLSNLSENIISVLLERLSRGRLSALTVFAEATLAKETVIQILDVVRSRSSLDSLTKWESSHFEALLKLLGKHAVIVPGCYTLLKDLLLTYIPQVNRPSYEQSTFYHRTLKTITWIAFTDSNLIDDRSQLLVGILNGKSEANRNSVLDSMRNVEDHGALETTLLDTVISLTRNKKVDHLDIRVNKPENRKKLLDRLANFLHSSQKHIRLSALYILHRRGYLQLGEPIFDTAINMALSDKAPVYVQPEARRIVIEATFRCMSAHLDTIFNTRKLFLLLVNAAYISNNPFVLPGPAGKARKIIHAIITSDRLKTWIAKLNPKDKGISYGEYKNFYEFFQRLFANDRKHFDMLLSETDENQAVPKPLLISALQTRPSGWGTSTKYRMRIDSLFENYIQGYPLPKEAVSSRAIKLRPEVKVITKTKEDLVEWLKNNQVGEIEIYSLNSYALELLLNVYLSDERFDCLLEAIIDRLDSFGKLSEVILQENDLLVNGRSFRFTRRESAVEQLKERLSRHRDLPEVYGTLQQAEVASLPVVRVSHLALLGNHSEYSHDNRILSYTDIEVDPASIASSSTAAL